MRYYIGQYVSTEGFACFYTSTSEDLAKFLANFLNSKLMCGCVVLSHDESLKNNIAVIGG